MTYRDFVDNDLLVLALVVGGMFCAWVGQMLLEIEEKKAGVVCVVLGLLLVTGVSIDRHWSFLDRQTKVLAVQEEKIRVEAAKKKADEERETARKKSEDDRKNLESAKKAAKSMFDDRVEKERTVAAALGRMGYPSVGESRVQTVEAMREEVEAKWVKQMLDCSNRLGANADDKVSVRIESGDVVCERE